MSVALNLQGTQLATAAKDTGQQRQAAAAARQFEGVLLQQVLRVLWQTAPGMKGPQAGMYQQMFEGPFAEHLAEGGGIGLAPMLERALGVGKNAASQVGTLHRNMPSALLPNLGPGTTAENGADLAPIGAPAAGETGVLQAVAQQMLASGGAQWSKDGKLSTNDLQSKFATEAAGGNARFSVRDAVGYQGYYKCNLFALEMARRAGFEVPVAARDRGWGFPDTAQVTADASDGKLKGGWARVVSDEPQTSLDQGLRDGSRAIILTGSGDGDHHGHMAVVERLHKIERAPNGDITRIVFDGWEARPDGASHLTERTWNLAGNGGGNLPRDGFQRIEILELKRPAQGAPNEVPTAQGAPASHRDDSGSSQMTGQPISGTEDRS